MVIALLCALVAAFIVFVLWVVVGYTALGITFFALLAVSAVLWVADVLRKRR